MMRKQFINDEAVITYLEIMVSKYQEVHYVSMYFYEKLRNWIKDRWRQENSYMVKHSQKRTESQSNRVTESRRSKPSDTSKLTIISIDECF